MQSADTQPDSTSTSDIAAQPFPEFVPGAEIVFDLAAKQVQATVVHVYHPFTMSAVLRVRLSGTQNIAGDLPPDSEAILKLFDRRFMNNDREDFRPPAPWSPKRDRAYAQWQQDLADGTVQPVDFDADDSDVEQSDWDFSDLSPGCLEGYLQHVAMTMYSREVHAYGVLSDLQGDLIPRLYGTVSYRDASTSVPGILIEYVPGPTMREVVATWSARSPRPLDAELARACEAAVDAMERVAQNDALVNRDVRIDNVIFRGLDDARAVVIDLAGCVAQDDRPLEDWRQWKRDMDEVGAIGQVLTFKVARQVGLGIWTYRGILPVLESDL